MKDVGQFHFSVIMVVVSSMVPNNVIHHQ